MIPDISHAQRADLLDKENDRLRAQNDLLQALLRSYELADERRELDRISRITIPIPLWLGCLLGRHKRGA